MACFGFCANPSLNRRGESTCRCISFFILYVIVWFKGQFDSSLVPLHLDQFCFPLQTFFSHVLFLLYLSGLCPSDSFDEAIADMITDGASDLREALIKIRFEKDEAKKASIIRYNNYYDDLCCMMLW